MGNQLKVVSETVRFSEIVFEKKGEAVTDSLMVAEVFGKDHNNVLKDIRKQIDYAGEEFGQVNFHQSTYINSQNKRMPKYDLSEDAFTLVVMSYNTKEAVQMKIKFIQEFKRMKEYIQNKPKAMNAKESILANMQATILLNEEVSTMKEDMSSVKADVKDLRENTPLFAIECEEISNAVKRQGVMLLGGKTSNAYRNRGVRTKVYKDMYRQLQRQFDVKSHKAIKRRHLGMAKSIVENYELPIVLSEEVTQVNNQISAEL